MREGKYCILHLRKAFERNLPVFINFVRGVDNRRFIHIVCYLGEDHGYHNTLTDLGYEVIHLGFSKKSLEVFNPFVITKLSGILRRKNIDIIHCQKHKPTIYGSLAALVSGNISVIAHVHGLARTRSWKRKLTNWFLLRGVKKIVAVSESVRKDVIKNNWGLDPYKVITVKNCIDLSTIDSIRISKGESRAQLGLAEDEFVFGTVGRLVATKGQSYLIEAFALVKERIPNARLVITGNGPLFGELQKKAANLGVASRVLFTGYRNNVFEMLRAFDIFVLPSLAEGLSIALLEAMASGLPIIASEVGGIPEVFGNCKCGKLVKPKDVRSLAAAMIEISYLDNDLKKNLGANGRTRIEEEFTADVMIKKLTELYESVLNNR
ncbi:MAG: glycosyltransferase [Nitrospirota bacterium]